MKESVDKCTKKTEIQSQKRQYEIAHMYNYVLKIIATIRKSGLYDLTRVA